MIVYSGESDITAMLTRLARGKITHQKAEWLARAEYRTHPWAGTPIPFDDLSEQHQTELIARARWALAERAEGDMLEMSDEGN